MPSPQRSCAMDKLMLDINRSHNSFVLMMNCCFAVESSSCIKVGIKCEAYARCDGNLLPSDLAFKHIFTPQLL